MSRRVAHLLSTLRSLMFRRSADRDLDDEIRYHLELEIETHQRAGLSPEEARRRALREMGAIENSKEECRDQRRGRWLWEFVSDLRYAGRTLRRAPGFASIAVGIMAIGIGANTAVFSLVNGVLLKSLPYPDADRLVVLRTTTTSSGQVNPLVTLANFWDWRAQSTSFEAMATYRGGEAPVTPADTAEYARHANVDVDLWRVLGIEPLVGRTFGPEDLIAGASQPVAMISHAFWQSRYGGDQDILRRTIRIGSGTRNIVGVMPDGFQFPNKTDVWTPQTNRTASRTSHSFLAVGRLGPGVSVQTAQVELDAIAARLALQFPDSNKGRGVSLELLQNQLVGGASLMLYLMWAAVGIVLLIACANVATLLLGRAASRTREIAVRTALGASRFRVVRQLITESLLLALLAGVGGTVLAYWGIAALVSVTPADIVRSMDTRIDGGVLAFTLVVSIFTSLVFGLAPALHASKVDLADAMKSGTRAGAGTGTVRARSALVVAEIALAVILLAGAGLLVKSLLALERVDLGFQPDNVLVMRATGVRARAENNAFFANVLPKIAALPGVQAVGATSVPPGDLALSGDGSYHIDRVPEVRDRDRDPQAMFTIVTPGAFAALGIPITRGRDFSDGDVAGQPLVAIVNEALVRASLPGQNPIGRTIFCSWDSKEGMTIVGVVGDARQRSPGVAPMPDCYMPYGQHAYNSNTLNVAIRVDGDPRALAPTVRKVAAQVAPDVPVSFTTMHETLARRMEEPRFRAFLFLVLAVVAAALATLGVYGVVAHAAAQRTREIGVRMALGANAESVLRMMIGRAAKLAVVGAAVGLAGAGAASSVLETMLFEVEPLDVQVYLGVVVILALVTLVASYLPARKAAVINPVDVLKAE